MNYFTAITKRDSTVGFRGVYSLSGIKIDGGTIQSDTTCPQAETTILNIQAASCPDFPDLRFQYNWYVKKPGEAKFDIIPNASGESFIYKDFENTGTTFVTYQFKRVGICAMGMAETLTSVIVAPNPWTVSLETYTNVYPSFTVNSTWAAMSKTHWKLEGAPAGISVAANNGLVSGLTANSVFFADVTVSSDKCPGQAWKKTLEVRREFAYTGGQQSITLAAGKYKMECWGAQGGTGGYQGTAGGKGGYTKGEISFISSKTMYVYVGQKGGSNSGIYGVGGSFNGGGGGGKGIHNWPGGCAGGGASDIRLESGVWSNASSLKSRLMIAAGGGGAGTNSTPAAAGGLNGYNCTTRGGSLIYGATQITGYAFGWGCTGRTCTTAYLCGAEGNGGGGGGYYGGSAYTGQGTNTDAGGAGGSSFISGHNGCNAINSSGTHTGQSIHYSGLYFTNTVMIDGAGYQWTTAKGGYVGMPNLTGTGTMTGNTGNGQVRISPAK